MGCEPFSGPNGSFGFVCRRSRGQDLSCRYCQKPTTTICDGCDSPICGAHHHIVTLGEDLCPKCAALKRERMKTR